MTEELKSKWGGQSLEEQLANIKWLMAVNRWHRLNEKALEYPYKLNPPTKGKKE